MNHLLIGAKGFGFDTWCLPRWAGLYEFFIVGNNAGFKVGSKLNAIFFAYKAFLFSL